jgi:large subunit ribosomal protein L31e
MAKKTEEPKIVLERNYNVPLRRQTLKSPPFRKAKKAIRTLKDFISKHMKSDNVSIGMHLNQKIWKHGMKNPPGMVKVTAIKDDKGRVTVDSVDAPKPKVEEKETKKKPKTDSKEKPEDKIEKKVEDAKEKKAEEAKKVEKEEIKELKKEHPKQHAPKVSKMPKQPLQRPTAPQSQ